MRRSSGLVLTCKEARSGRTGTQMVIHRGPIVCNRKNIPRGSRPTRPSTRSPNRELHTDPRPNSIFHPSIQPHHKSPTMCEINVHGCYCSTPTCKRKYTYVKLVRCRRRRRRRRTACSHPERFDLYHSEHSPNCQKCAFCRHTSSCDECTGPPISLFALARCPGSKTTMRNAGIERLDIWDKKDGEDNFWFDENGKSRGIWTFDINVRPLIVA